MSAIKTIAHRTQVVKGRVKVTVGRITGNRRLRAEGRRDQAKGNIKQYGAKIKHVFER